METLKFSPVQDKDNTQIISRDGIKLATIWYDFNTVVLEQQTNMIAIEDIIAISENVRYIQFAVA